MCMDSVSIHLAKNESRLINFKTRQVSGRVHFLVVSKVHKEKLPHFVQYWF